VKPQGQPDSRYFAVMAEVATSHWWYVARRELFRQLLAGRVTPGGTALDVGCGTGETMTVLRSLGAARVAGTDLSDDALAHARLRGGDGSGGSVMAALAEQLPFGDGTADVLVSSDVLEHLDDDRLGLREYRRVLRRGGTLLVTVPSYPWLWGPHDDAAGHRRRYAGGQLASVVAGCGFRVERSSAFFSFLVPPAALVRRTPLGKLVSGSDDEASAGAVSTALFGRLAGLERAALRRRDIPFGLSQFVVATAVDEP